MNTISLMSCTWNGKDFTIELTKEDRVWSSTSSKVQDLYSWLDSLTIAKQKSRKVVVHTFISMED